MKIRDTFRFGKYEGKSLHKIVSDHPEYVIWCLDNVSWFNLDWETFLGMLSMLEGEMPEGFTPGKNSLENRFSEAYAAKNETCQEDSDGDEEDPHYREEPSYEEHNGAFGYDDDTINSAFEGDPSNCWNVD